MVISVFISRFIVSTTAAPSRHDAAEKGHEAVVRLLLAHAADVNAKTGCVDCAPGRAAAKKWRAVCEARLDTAPPGSTAPAHSCLAGSSNKQTTGQLFKFLFLLSISQSFRF